MGKIHLLRTDLPQEPEVTLVTEDANSEVIIGRGATLKCDDKRVSRNHCSLRILPDGGIVLVARHSNPCFYKIRGQSSVFTLLPRNESITLHQGDEFSLLPESFRYLISMHREHNGDSNLTVSEATRTALETTQICVDNSEETDNSHNGVSNETFPPVASTSVTREPMPPRVLPDWLTNLPPSNNTPARSEARKRKIEEQKSRMDKKQKNSYNEARKDNRNVPTEQTSIIPTTESREDHIDTAITQPRVASPSLLPLPASEMLPESQCAQSSNKEGYEESWGARGLARVKIEPGLEANVDAQPSAKPIRIKEEPIKEEPVDEQPANDTPDDLDQGASCSTTTAPAAATSSTREMCLYGSACYRRNPQHRTDFSHPGDPDYDSAADNLPECQYGTSCYRKNVQHRKDFKHTKKMSPPPQPQPRARPAQANSMAPNIYCRSCSIVYTVCTRCNGVGIDAHQDPIDLTEDDEGDEDVLDDDFDDDCHQNQPDKPPDSDNASH